MSGTRSGTRQSSDIFTATSAPPPPGFRNTSRPRRIPFAPMGTCLLLVGISLLIDVASIAEEPAPQVDLDPVVTLLEFVLEADEGTAVECLEKILEHGEASELSPAQLAGLRERLGAGLRPRWLPVESTPLHDAALRLAAIWGDEEAVRAAREILLEPTQPASRRASMATSLVRMTSPELIRDLSKLLSQPDLPPLLQTAVLHALAKSQSPQVAAVLLGSYRQFPPEIQAQTMTLLTQRSEWSKELVHAVRRQTIPASAVGLTHLRSLVATKDPELAGLVKEQWGAVRTERNPEREQVIGRMRTFLEKTPGEPLRGRVVFDRVCGQCHKIHGKGQEVGPDITSNGRSHFDQLLSNVFDPSLVIGPAYQAVTVVTTDGRILTGLLAEDSDQRIVLKTQGGKLESVPRAEVEESVPSKLSLMPENLEQQIPPAELADLFSFLSLDKPPEDPAAKWIPGTPVR